MTRNYHLKKQIVFWLLIGGFLGLFSSPIYAQPPDGSAKIAPDVLDAMRSLPPGEMLTVIVTLQPQANLSQLQATPNRAARLNNVVTRLQSTAQASQRGIRALLAARQAQGDVSEVIPFWIFNGLAVTATPAVIQTLATQPEVQRITSNETFQAPPFSAQQGEIGALSLSQPNLSLINAPALWNLGYRGAGIVVANTDTGVDLTHPDLGPKWRGGTNSWYDPYGENPVAPVDMAGSSSGHGTQTMGLMVGGDHNGIAFGLAPEARWIAVKMFRNNGSGTAAGFHAGLQWLLDPDGNPGTPDAPHVVNNSWTAATGCNLAFQLDLQALRAAGILPVFAAGNTAYTSYSPANYPEAFAVGAINNSDTIWTSSSHGPSACDTTIYPEVVAPGVNVHTTFLTPLYTNGSGTSFAAPHVAGGLALLLNAVPTMSVTEQENTLINNAVDLGSAGPDNIYGNGRIDLLAALKPFSADLDLVQLASADPIITGQTLTYTLTITNNGPLSADDVDLVTGEFPTEVSIDQVTTSQGSCDDDDNAVICTLGHISNNNSATIILELTPAGMGAITNTVTIAAASRPDTDLANNTTMLNVSIVAAHQVYLPVVIK